MRDPEDWLIGIPWVIMALILLIGGILYVADQTQRTPEPCTLACER